MSKKSAEDPGRQLRKLAQRMLALAEEADREVQRSGQRTTRLEGRLTRRAAGILLDSLEFGGPEDSRLRLVVQSWRNARSKRSLDGPEMFRQANAAWPPLRTAGDCINLRNPRALALALRTLAHGIRDVVEGQPSSS